MIPVLIRAVDLLFNAFYIILFARILMSWFPAGQGSLRLFLHRVTEPVLTPIRMLVHRSPLGGPGTFIDFAPIFAFLLTFLLRDFTISMLQRL